jgi:hypothetical protein
MARVRKYPGIGGRRHNPVGGAEKRAEAIARNEAWAQLSPKEQLAVLDSRLGAGVGAARQRARIKLEEVAAKKGKAFEASLREDAKSAPKKGKGGRRGAAPPE